MAHAARRYPQARFVRGNLAALPIRSAAVDSVVTLQVIEHVWDLGGFVRDCRRVLRPDGQLVVTTPNRITFSPGYDEPVNPFHTREFTARELTELLAAHGFAPTWLGGLHAGTRLRALDDAHGGSFVTAQLARERDRWRRQLSRDVARVGAVDFEVVSAADATSTRHSTSSSSPDRSPPEVPHGVRRSPDSVRPTPSRSRIIAPTSSQPE